MSDAGARILRENGIADPTAYMAEELSDDLGRRYDLKVEQQALYITDDDPTQITAKYPAADLLLDVWITSLSLEPFSRDSQTYRVRYAANLRLIDARIVHLIDGKKGLVVAHGRCLRVPEETPSSPTYDDFLANGAQRLVHELHIAAQSCIDEFRSQVLTVRTP